MNIAEEVLQQLQLRAEPGFKERQASFSKDAFQSLGLRNADTHAVAKETYEWVKPFGADELLATCGELFAVGYWEMDIVAIDWAWLHRKHLGKQHFPVLRSWLENHVVTWAGCDHLCCGILGEMLRRYPEFLTELPLWAESTNRWVRRGAAVVMIPGFRKSPDAMPVLFGIATTLLPDRDDMVQKGYGWALKEACKQDEGAVFDFVMAHKAVMPRTALRYAIEKMPDERRALAMAKD